MCAGNEDRKAAIKKKKRSIQTEENINESAKSYTITNIPIPKAYKTRSMNKVLKKEEGKIDIAKNYELDDITVPTKIKLHRQDSSDITALWQRHTKNPDNKLATIHSSNVGFRSKMNSTNGSYLIYNFVKKTLERLNEHVQQPFLYEIFDEIQNELGQSQQLPVFTYNNNTSFIKFMAKKSTNNILLGDYTNSIVGKNTTNKEQSIDLDALSEYLDDIIQPTDNMNIELINMNSNNNDNSKTHSDLWKWLNNIHMIEYYNLFVEQGFEETPQMISYITNDVLITIGISNLQHRKIIMEYIYDIKNDNGNGVKDSTKQMKIGLTTRIREKFNSKQTDLDGLTNYLDYVYESKNDDELSINKKDVNKLDHTVNDNDDINIVYDTAK